MKRKPQRDIVLEHIQKYGYITSMDAYEEYGITQLATRIKELKTLGFEITTKREYITNRFGKPTHYDKYYLGGI